MEALTEKIMEKDETIPELPPKDLVSFFLLIFLTLMILAEYVVC